MMNVKKYRATTTREALEQIKQDLGEDAFVLETRQVKSGGFLGFKSGTQIEISAAAPMFADKKTATAATKSYSAPSHQILNLKDDTVAVPAKSAGQNLDEKKNILSALNSRAALSHNFENAVTNFTSTLAEVSAKPKKAIESVEISTEAPRFVHPKKDLLKQTSPEPKSPAVEIADSLPVIHNF